MYYRTSALFLPIVLFVGVLLVVGTGCNRGGQAVVEPTPEASPGGRMTSRQRVTALVNRNGDVNDPATPRPLLTLAEFFDGNDDETSLGVNLSPRPGPAKFREVLTRIAARPGVADVRVQIDYFEPYDEWPQSDTVLIITGESPETVREWFDPSMSPDECWAGRLPTLTYEPISIPEGMKPVLCWWD